MVVEPGEHERQLFIPGILDDVTLEHITTKLPWKSLFVMASLNRAWKKAIQDREVYKIRLRARATQTALVSTLLQTYQRPNVFWDLRKQWTFQLAWLPYIWNLWESMLVLDGKLFAYCYASRDMYMLDLGACRCLWKQCSTPSWCWCRPHVLVHSFSVACRHKIYKFDVYQSTLNGEVFDPENDTWTSVAEKLSFDSYDTQVSNWSQDNGNITSLNDEIYVSLYGENILVFNALSERWREMTNTGLGSGRKCLVVMGVKLYSLSVDCVHVYDSSSDSWSHVQDISHEHSSGSRVDDCSLIKALSFGDELLGSFSDDRCIQRLHKSVGFGVKGRTLMWEEHPLQLGADIDDTWSFLLVDL